MEHESDVTTECLHQVGKNEDFSSNFQHTLSEQAAVESCSVFNDLKKSPQQDEQEVL